MVGIGGHPVCWFMDRTGTLNLVLFCRFMVLSITVSEIMSRNSYNCWSILRTRMVDPRDVLHPEVEHEIRVDWLDTLPSNKALLRALWFIVIKVYFSMSLIFVYSDPYLHTCQTWSNLPGVWAPVSIAPWINSVYKSSHQQEDKDHRSSRRGMFCKEAVLRSFAKLTGKHLCQSLFFNKVAGLGSGLKKRLWHRGFPVNFAKFQRTSFIIDRLWWLLLSIKFSYICVKKICHTSYFL